mgnify:CR=1 FL=1
MIVIISTLAYDWISGPILWFCQDTRLWGRAIELAAPATGFRESTRGWCESPGRVASVALCFTVQTAKYPLHLKETRSSAFHPTLGDRSAIDALNPIHSFVDEEPELRIGFIGAGQMGRALGRGFVRASLCQPEDLLAFDPIAATVEQFAAELPGATQCASNAEVVTTADVVFLAVKPQCLSDVLLELQGGTPATCLFVSIIAGTSLTTLCEGLRSQRVVRVMPNTPCLIGCGAAGYAVGPGASDEDAQLVARLLESVGTAFRVTEKQIDAVTGLSGSGPAYVYTMIEALSDGGVRMGLPRATATALAAQTVYGAAKMVLETAEHPAVLRDRVASPGGTTIAGLQVLEQNGLRAGLIDAVEAATLRSQELGSGG